MPDPVSFVTKNAINPVKSKAASVTQGYMPKDYQVPVSSRLPAGDTTYLDKMKKADVEALQKDTGIKITDDATLQKAVQAKSEKDSTFLKNCGSLSSAIGGGTKSVNSVIYGSSEKADAKTTAQANMAKKAKNVCKTYPNSGCTLCNQLQIDSLLNDMLLNNAADRLNGLLDSSIDLGFTQLFGQIINCVANLQRTMSKNLNYVNKVRAICNKGNPGMAFELLSVQYNPNAGTHFSHMQYSAMQRLAGRTDMAFGSGNAGLLSQVCALNGTSPKGLFSKGLTTLGGSAISTKNLQYLTSKSNTFGQMALGRTAFARHVGLVNRFRVKNRFKSS